MILQLENHGEESVIILNAVGQDQAAPRVLSALFRVSIHILQHGVIYAAVQVGSSWVVVGVKVIWLYVPHITHWVDEAVRRVHGNGHGIVADKGAKGMPLAGVTSSLKSIPHHLEVDLYVPDEVDPADNVSHIDICDLLMPAICLKDQEDGSSPAEL